MSIHYELSHNTEQWVVSHAVKPCADQTFVINISTNIIIITENKRNPKKTFTLESPTENKIRFLDVRMRKLPSTTFETFAYEAVVHYDSSVCLEVSPLSNSHGFVADGKF